MISKKLLTEVLGLVEEPNKIILVSRNKYENNIKQTLQISYNNGSEPNEINIYELAHKCKEWAFKQHFEIHSASNSLYGDKPIAYIQDTALCGVELPSIFEANIEPEAVFKACEWILKQKEIL